MVDVSSQNNSVSINVSSSGNSASIKATPDTALYYSEKSREYAISDKLIDGKDYSSKYYANKSAISESNAKGYAQSSQDTYNQFQQSVEGALSNVDIVVQGAVDSINIVKNTAVDDINATKTNILKDIEFVAEGEKEEIQELADKAKDDIESTGFYMRDDKLYFINSNGEEEEFKSGGLDDKITNCLLEVPQRIKFEQQSDRIILKAGSVVIIPDGFEADGVTPKFEYRTISTDMHILEQYMGGTGTLNYVYNAITYGIDFININDTTSSTSPITTGGLNYNLSTNNIKIYSGSDVVYSDKVSLPFMQVSVVDSQITSVVAYNGMGYIGSTVWIDKGVKGLIPNGRNEDGTLKNIEVVTDNVQTMRCLYTDGLDLCIFVNGDLSANTFNNNQGAYFVDSLSEKPAVSGTYSWCFSSQDNRWYQNQGTTTWQEFPIIYIGKVFCDSNLKITSTQFKEPFRAVDYNDKSEIVSWCVPDYSAGVAISSGYIAPENGWVVTAGVHWQQRPCSFSVNGILIAKPQYPGVGGISTALSMSIPVLKGQTVTFENMQTAYFFPMKGAK